MLVLDAISPAPRCLRMFLLEKSLQLDSQFIDVMTGENRETNYLAINPAGQVPSLRLDDGSYITESVAIAEYLEELYPQPVLIGNSPKERAITRMWWRRVELNITEFIHNAFHYSEGLKRFESRIPISPEAAPGLKMVAQDRIQWLDSMIHGPYLCGERFSAADIWLYVWLDFANQASVNQPIDFNRLENLSGWFEKISKRASAQLSEKPLHEIKTNS
ncbi:glutathione S-transferase family protein [Candidatus Nitrosacidococcus tergens]|uniref:Glutathione S-transferase, N-terminal domain n=1 Tax=Candidatus Nitrosacidococcus tergens TaxID=553981 RepID=A0A7G1Q8T9_9GAMM|nr:glutathione S-transferase family protein [Candidatus Nitrosacidococcus tergens]CAB1275267.1 Glutathione S-transferase, N-terminal domain [Candidatus Nitrosacidococcus tergens]